jgi:hypothetical protein
MGLKKGQRSPFMANHCKHGRRIGSGSGDNSDTDVDNVNLSATREPASLKLLGFGIVGMGEYVCRRPKLLAAYSGSGRITRTAVVPHFPDCI